MGLLLHGEHFDLSRQTHIEVSLTCRLLKIENGSRSALLVAYPAGSSTYSKNAVPWLALLPTPACNTGYNPTGDITRLCQANEEWCGREPTCLRKLLCIIYHCAISPQLLTVDHSLPGFDTTDFIVWMRAKFESVETDKNLCSIHNGWKTIIIKWICNYEN